MCSEEIAVVFPGQGSQRSGMGKDFYDQIPASREVYEEACDALGWDIGQLCFGEDERLDLTEYTQPCILATEMAMFRGLKDRYGFCPTWFGGHSLGEFTALVASGALSLEEAVRIVHKRGQLMQDAVPVGIGTMSAIIAENMAVDEIRQALADLPVDVANINSDHQVVLSGVVDAMPDAAIRIQDTMTNGQTFRFVPLNVSAPFHSRFMRAVEMPFEETLRHIGKGLNPEKAVAVTSNLTGEFHEEFEENIIHDLVLQVSETVQWKTNMRRLADRADRIYEMGPGRPLRDFFKTMDVQCSSITTLSSAEKLFGREQ
jgi:[acyl-carrier-protein] S-malonyltransferase